MRILNKYNKKIEIIISNNFNVHKCEKLQSLRVILQERRKKEGAFLPEQLHKSLSGVSRLLELRR